MSHSNNSRPIITHSNPKSPISEAYRTLRTNIDFSSIDASMRVMMLTSAGPGEGKSTTTTNLAVAYAQADKKVLVIDADMRKPTMHHTFLKTNRRGLSNVIAGQATADEVILETQVNNLFLMTAGPIPPNPSEMLSSKKMTAMLEELKETFDMIIIDTPPALAVTDAQIVATKCDGVLLVVDYGRVKREAAIKVKSNLEHVNAKLIGVVLNNVDRKSGENYYYYYYGNEQKEEK
ncbi:CpsD/CapB family tyrosine-protein kinase [Paenibacillus sp. MBLB4367]|uniref:CpsD/CapB family tyrosine-protein kinase n=1 Tax=Paenibacillus sp. MBLB4367 TaxID=3384767 RepID=UPI0039081CC4